MASAKQIRDEIMRMTIVVNSNPAQQEIYKLTEANRKFAEESTKLRDERVKVGQTLGKNSQEYKDLTDKINGNSSSITENKRKVKELADTLDISQMSVKQLKQEAILLRKELDRVVPGSNQYKALQTQLGAVNGRLAEVRGGANATSSSFGSLADKFNHYSGIITAGIAMFVGFGVSIQAVIDRNNKLVDAQTAVAKTVNMTKEEVEDLTKTFSDFDTRTSRLDLLKIAETGGRLGVGKAQIKDFVQEVDKANVALGDGFAGGVEAVTDNLGKLKNLYGETKDLDMATAINQIGSAMNELGASGAATEENIGDFALRLGSLPAKLKPTIAEALALGAAFEESGINAERGGTAYSTFVRNAATNAGKFAKVMNISKKEVEDLMNADPLEFFLKFSEGMKGMDTTDLAKTMEYLKMNDQYVISTMGAASENTDKFRASINLSNKSLTEATSLTNEFNKVNNNSAAIFEKVQKKMLGLFTSETISKFLNTTINLFGQFIGAIDEGNSTFQFYRSTLLVLVKILSVIGLSYVTISGAVSLYNALILKTAERTLALTVIEKVRNATTIISTALTTGYTVVLSLLAFAYASVTGKTNQATFAMNTFKIAMATNPIGAVVAIVSVLATAFFTLSAMMRDNTEELKKNAAEMDFAGQTSKRVLDEQAKAIGEVKSKIDPLIETLKDEKSQLNERKKAYQELIKIHPEFIGTLDKEYRSTGKLISVYDTLIQKLKDAAEVRVLTAMLDEQTTKRMKVQSYSEMINTTKEELEPTATVTIGGKKVILKGNNLNPENEGKIKLFNNLAKNTNKELEQIDSNIDKITQKIIDKNKKEQADFTVPEPEIKTASSPKPKSTTAAENQHEKEMQDAERRGVQAEELARQIALNIEDAKIEAMEDGFEKELAALDLQEQRKLAEIDKNKVAQYEFDAIDKKIAKATGDDKDLFESLKKSWTDNNADLEKQKAGQMELFNIKRKALKFKFENEDFKDKDDAFKRELSLLERQKNEELAGFKDLAELKASLKGRMNDKEISEITTWEEGKTALNKVYQQKEIEMQVAHMQTMLALYEGLDLSILTKEQQDQVLKFIDDAKNKVAELKAVQNSTDKGEGKGLKGKLGGKGSSDILGMSPSDWELFFTNIETGADALGTMQAAVSALQSAFGAYYQYVQANEQAQMQQVDATFKKRERRLKAMLNSGQISQEQYEKDMQALQQETDNKKARLEYEAAKRKRGMDIANIITSTALGIMNIWATTGINPIMAGILTGIVGALGAVQLATVIAQPLPSAPGYEDGFYNMRRSQDGKEFRVKRKRLSSGEVHSPTHFIAGERGTEMVIDSPTYTRFRPEVKRMLHNEISYSRGFEGGMYRNNASSGSSNNEEKLMMIIEQNTMAMNAIRDKKFIAYLAKNMDNAKEIIDMTDEYSGYKNSSKK